MPGSLLVLANFFLFIIVLIKLDFPTLDFPTKTISGKLFLGYCLGLTAEISNLGFLTNMYIFSFLRQEGQVLFVSYILFYSFLIFIN